MPKIDIASIKTEIGTGYPDPFHLPVAGRARKRLGNAAGLDQFGVNLTRIPPGEQSSQRHWHQSEDEFVYVLEGEVVLRSDAGEQLLRAGMCAGFPAGSSDGHQLINRGTAPALYLEMSNRDPADTGHYSDSEVDLVWNPPQARGKFTRRDGSPC